MKLKPQKFTYEYLAMIKKAYGISVKPINSVQLIEFLREHRIARKIDYK